MMSKNRRFSLWIWIAIGVVLVAGLVAALMPRPHEVQVTAVREAPFTVEVVDLGVTRVKDLFSVSTPFAGRLERITLQPGDRVTAGQVVARLRAAPATPLDERRAAETAAAVQAATFRRDEARARRDTVHADLERALRLAQQGYVAASALDAARSADREATARLQAAEADLRQARASAGAPVPAAGSIVEVRSPVAGTVLRRLAQSEAVLPGGTVLLDLGDTAAIEVAAEFLSADAQRVKAGARANFVVPQQPPVAARVVRVEPTGERKISALGVEEQRVKIVLDLDQPPANLGHGFQGDVRIETESLPAALLLPVEALVRDGPRWAVMRVKEGRAERVFVDVGATNGIDRHIRKGLAKGDEVVLAPTPALENGQRVAVKTPTPR